MSMKSLHQILFFIGIAATLQTVPNHTAESHSQQDFLDRCTKVDIDTFIHDFLNKEGDDEISKTDHLNFVDDALHAVLKSAKVAPFELTKKKVSWLLFFDAWPFIRIHETDDEKGNDAYDLAKNEELFPLEQERIEIQKLLQWRKDTETEFKKQNEDILKKYKLIE